ncbi:MAG TPA: F0F1 ATP synthase subunit B [Firmicutes bacterium]|nr:F0F1 ATP synthase subunit B [Bacillota bacterium]
MRLDYTYVFQILNFIVLFLLLRRYLFGPVKAYLDRREQYIRDRISAAENDRNHAAKLREELQTDLARARAKAGEIVEQARRASEQIKAEARRMAAEEAARIMTRAREEAARQKEQALQEIRRQAVDISVAVASKVIRSVLDREALRREASAAARDILEATPRTNVHGGTAS